jgi:signal transduction histidine kinase
LRKRLLDYTDPIPAGQRRFLMRQLDALYPNQPTFPTLAAEELAARYLESESSQSPPSGLSESALPGIWQCPSASGRVIGLHRTDQLAKRIQAAAAAALPAELSIEALPPGKDADGSFFAVPAGQSLPGWRLAFTLLDQRSLETAANQRVASYGWIAAIVIGSISILGLLALGLIRRQVALTRLRNDLVANVTHELKTPLSSMRLLVDTLIQTPTLNETTAREYLALIARENLRLSRLIDNFLTFSRIERNKYSFVFKEVRAQQIAEDAVAAVQERFSAPGCHLTVELGSNLPTLVADGDAVVTALVNLLDNAWKYSGEQKQVTLQTAAENGTVRFSVQDNGIGLSRRESKRIFKRFYQVNQKGSHSGGGCGLGLSIVDFIITAHGGTVTVESEPGQGSTFIVSLPLKPKRLTES